MLTDHEPLAKHHPTQSPSIISSILLVSLGAVSILLMRKLRHRKDVGLFEVTAAPPDFKSRWATFQSSGLWDATEFICNFTDCKCRKGEIQWIVLKMNILEKQIPTSWQLWGLVKVDSVSHQVRKQTVPKPKAASTPGRVMSSGDQQGTFWFERSRVEPQILPRWFCCPARLGNLWSSLFPQIPTGLLPRQTEIDLLFSISQSLWVLSTSCWPSLVTPCPSYSGFHSWPNPLAFSLTRIMSHQPSRTPCAAWPSRPKEFTVCEEIRKL